MHRNDSQSSLNFQRPSTVMTLNRSEPIRDETTQTNPILKKKLISFPIPKIEEQQIPIEEYRTILQKHHKYRTQVQAQETIDEIAEFERKHFGKTEIPKAIEIQELDRIQKQTIEEFAMDDTRYEPYRPRATLSTAVASATCVVNRPAMWNVIDEPLAPARSKSHPPKIKTDISPFVSPTKLDDRYGIPLVDQDLQKRNKRKMNQYNSTMRYLKTCENQVREDQIRVLVQKDRAARIAKREKKAAMCADLGQKWALRSLGRLPVKHEKDDSNVISPEDLEALAMLNKRDADLMDQYREAKKEGERLEMAPYA